MSLYGYNFQFTKVLIKRAQVFGLPRWLSGKESAPSAGDVGSISGLGRSPGGGNSDSPQYSCLGEMPGTEEPGRLQSIGSQRVF